MGRRIVTARMASQGVAVAAAPGVDGYFDRLVKYIPADVVAAYVAVQGVLPGVRAGETPAPTWLTWGLIAVFAAITAVWTYRQTRTPAARAPAATQVITATAGFLVWAFALGGEPFASLGWYGDMPYLGSIVLVVFMLAAATVVPGE